MGRVFTFEEIEQGKVPFHSEFVSLAQFIRECLPHRRFVSAALMFGSYLKSERQDFNCRSDLDVIVVYERARADEARKLFAQWHNLARRGHVPLGLITVDHIAAAHGAHFVSPTFMRELAWAEENGGALHNRVTHLLTKPTIDAATDRATYLVRKLHKLEDGLNRVNEMTEIERCELRRRALSAPIHAARKVLEGRDIDCAGRSRREIVDLMRDSTPRTFAMMLKSIVKADAELTTATQHAFQDPEGNTQAYKDALGAVDAVIPIAHHLLWRMANEP